MTHARRIRLINAGTLSPVRSQSIYHGLAHARTDTTPDTIVLATPAAPYVSIGFHQDTELELDLSYCEREGLPIVRREVGGGVVYLDSDQLFVQWIMDPRSLPRRVDQRFKLFAQPLIDTYHELGVDARFRPVNDIHVDGKKIGGTGAGHVGNAEVLVGNFLFDFNSDRMARIVRAPSSEFRDAVRDHLARFMTTLAREVVDPPDPSMVAGLYCNHLEHVLEAELFEGQPTADELREIEAVEARFLDAAFVHRPGGLVRPGVKIHEDVWVHYKDYES